MLYDSLKDLLKRAMKEKKRADLDVIRSILTKISEHQVKQKIDRNSCDDATFSKIVSSYKNSLEKAITSLTNGGQGESELVRQYETEIKFCEKLLPKSLSESELENQIREQLEAHQISDMKDAGKIIGVIIKNNPPGTVNGKTIKETINKLLEQ